MLIALSAISGYPLATGAFAQPLRKSEKAFLMAAGTMRFSARLDFEDSDDADVLLACEAEFKAYWSPVGAHVEALRDELITALLQRFQPEFESMVEVEVLDA